MNFLHDDTVHALQLERYWCINSNIHRRSYVLELSVANSREFVPIFDNFLVLPAIRKMTLPKPYSAYTTVHIRVKIVIDARFIYNGTM